MTRGEAVDELKYIKESFAQCELSHEALDMAIKALEEMEQSCRGCRFFCSKYYYDGICKTCTRNYSDRYVKEGEEHD